MYTLFRMGTLILFLLSAGLPVHAGFTSPHYSIDSYSIGGTESSMSSENYSLSPRYDGSDTVVAPKEDPDVPPTEKKNGTSQGTRVSEQIEDEHAVISNDFTTEASSTYPQKTRGSEFRDFLTRVSTSGEITLPQIQNTLGNSFDDAVTEDGNTSLLASVISGDFQKIFGQRSARVVVFLLVLSALLYIRSSTRIGRRFTPF